MAPEDTTGDAPERSERIQEAVAKLHPQLQEALRNAPAAATYTLKCGDYQGEFTQQEELLRCIDNLNDVVNNIMRALENEEGRHLWPRAGDDLLFKVGINGRLLWEGGMYGIVMTSLRAFALTKLREEAKTPSTEPFNQEEFERECMIHSIMQTLLGPIDRGGGGFQAGDGVG